MDAEQWDARYQAADRLWSLEPNRFLVEEVGGLRPGKALDLAAGEGRNSVWLAELGWDVLAVDFSAVGLERARQLAERRGVHIETVQCNVLEFRPRPEFDLVVVAYVHLRPDHRRRLLETARQALQPGGRAVVIGHDVTNLDGGYGGPSVPEVLYDPTEIAGELAPLRVLSSRRVLRPVDTDEGPRTAVDSLTVAIRDV